MLKTFCIKSNNNIINNYIISNIKKIKLENIYLSIHNFSLYTNIIIHYKGTEIEKFSNKISNILTNVIFLFYTKPLVVNLINTNYFYFSDFDKSIIYNYCLNDLKQNDFKKNSKNILKKTFHNFFKHNKKIFLDGFVSFSLKNYISLLDKIVDHNVNKFIIDKQYIEFIELLKCYIASRNNSKPLIHLVYSESSSEQSLLFDENFEPLPINYIKSPYLSDISFSQNDYCLNTLLTLAPQQLIVYSQNNLKDEFLTTLELIFEDKMTFCQGDRPLDMSEGLSP